MHRQKKQPSRDVEPKEGAAENSAPEPDLSATVGAFKTRFQKKLQEKVSADSQESEKTRLRQSLIFETMMNIRKSLSQVAKIDLGDRFEFSLEYDDWQGWPRLTIRLIDQVRPDAEYPRFQVIAHDRQARAAIEIVPGDPQKTLRVSLVREQDKENLTSVLKKSVRQFLEQVEEIVLQAEQRELAEAEEGNLDKTDEAPEESEKDAPDEELTGDLFEDEEYGNDFLEQLPQMEEVESLATDSGIYNYEKDSQKQ